jgi:superkiller protein 3
MFFESGHLQQAKNWYQRAIEIDPEDAEAYANMADVLYEQQKRSDAREYALRALELDERCAPAWLTLGYLHMDADEIMQACRCFERFLDIEDSSVAADLIVEVNAVLKGLKGD